MTQGRCVLGDLKVGGEIVVFSDYKCPVRRDFERASLPVIERDLVASGQAHVVSLHSPFLADDSRAAVVAAECAYRQGNALFFKYNVALYARQGDECAAWAMTDLLRDVARGVGLNFAGYERCLGAQAAPEQVQRDVDQHQAAGMLGTPGAFVNGKQIPAGVNEIRAALNNAQPP